MTPTTSTTSTKAAVHVFAPRAGARQRTPSQHLRRALRTLRVGVFRARRDLGDALSRAGLELGDAVKSLAATFRAGG